MLYLCVFVLTNCFKSCFFNVSFSTSEFRSQNPFMSKHLQPNLKAMLPYAPMQTLRKKTCWGCNGHVPWESNAWSTPWAEDKQNYGLLILDFSLQLIGLDRNQISLGFDTFCRMHPLIDAFSLTTTAIISTWALLLNCRPMLACSRPRSAGHFGTRWPTSTREVHVENDTDRM